MQAHVSSQLIATDRIEVIDRLRPIDDEWVAALAGSLTKQGQLQAIEVARLPGNDNYRLVYGAHRLAAARLLGWDNIAAVVVKGDQAVRRSREIVENVFRRDLDPLDRAAFVAELWALEKAAAGIAADADARTHSANVRWQKALKEQSTDATATIASAYGLQGAVAAKLGMSERTVRDDLLLFKRLSASVTARVRVLPLAHNAAALKKLAALEPADQAKALLLIENGKVKDVNGAIAHIQKRPPVDAATKRLKTFTDTYSRMSKREQRDAFRVLSRMLPAGVIQIVFDDEVKDAAE